MQHQCAQVDNMNMSVGQLFPCKTAPLPSLQKSSVWLDWRQQTATHAGFDVQLLSDHIPILMHQSLQGCIPTSQHQGRGLKDSNKGLLHILATTPQCRQTTLSSTLLRTQLRHNQDTPCTTRSLDSRPACPWQLACTRTIHISTHTHLPTKATCLSQHGQ